MHVFYFGMNFYGVSQVVLVTAEDEMEARRLIDEEHGKEFSNGYTLVEIDPGEKGIITLIPPGNREVGTW
ncbi:MAG: hypothetical protein HYT93_00475 [Parcubacteria group bacterium]|nr:hypothetical protein [Parcubacteria group bacterium]